MFLSLKGPVPSFLMQQLWFKLYTSLLQVFDIKKLLLFLTWFVFVSGLNEIFFIEPPVYDRNYSVEFRRDPDKISLSPLLEVYTR